MVLDALTEAQEVAGACPQTSPQNIRRNVKMISFLFMMILFMDAY